MDYIIETDFQGPGFVAVPNHVLDVPGLSPEAIGLLVWFARQPRGFIARAAAVQERFGIGKDRWQRIARELRGCGAIRLARIRGQGGRLVGGHYVIRWPDAKRAPLEMAVSEVRGTISRKTRLMVHKPGKPADGKPGSPEPENPADLSRKTRLLNKEEDLRLSEAVEFSAFQRALLREGKPVLIGSVLLKPGSQAFEAAALAARALDARELQQWSANRSRAVQHG